MRRIKSFWVYSRAALLQAVRLQALGTCLWEQDPWEDRRIADGEWQVHFIIAEGGQLFTFVDVWLVSGKGSLLAPHRLRKLETHSPGRWGWKWNGRELLLFVCLFVWNQISDYYLLRSLPLDNSFRINRKCLFEQNWFSFTTWTEGCFSPASGDAG